MEALTNFELEKKAKTIQRRVNRLYYRLMEEQFGPEEKTGIFSCSIFLILLRLTLISSKLQIDQ